MGRRKDRDDIEEELVDTSEGGRVDKRMQSVDGWMTLGRVEKQRKERVEKDKRERGKG